MQLGTGADDGSNAQCTGQDSRMGIGTATGCDKSQDFVRIELQCFTGSQIISGDDDLIVCAEVNSFTAA